ncbi:MAG TPA: glycosyltransferase [Blastocatellia bacterium]|nr:glycosyltransferase [Blastocatellia bacterium]
MNPEPLVSIIMTFLNAERFIQEAIESVLEQSYANWELLLIDDGSTDSSGEVARQYAVMYAGKMRYLSHAGGANLGMSASRNLGINSARGELIAFLDADDVWLPEKLERQVEILRSQPAAAMVCGRTQYWYSWSGKQEDLSRDFVPELGVPLDRLVDPPALFPALMRNQVVTSTGGLVRREAIETVGGYEERFRGLYEDQAFYAKVCLKAPVFISDGCWYKYRKHPDSCCAVAESLGRHHAERLLLLNWLESYLSENAIKDKGVWQSLRRAQWTCRFPKLSRTPGHIRYRTRMTKERMKSIARRIVPAPIYGLIKARRRKRDSPPQTGAIRFGDLRRLAPFSRVFGYDRGTPVDRYYIEGFLAHNHRDIRGRVLEVGDDTYTRRYGGERVDKIDVLHVTEGSPQATIIADLTKADHIPSESFDCIIFTQTLHLIYDVRAAIKTLHRILKPGGVLLATFPGITQIDRYEWGKSWYWAFTTLAARRLFGEAFSERSLAVETNGNVLAATAFLYGIALEELRKEELDFNDPDYEVTITVRAVKGAE